MCENSWRKPVHLDPHVRERLVENLDWLRMISPEIH